MAENRETKNQRISKNQKEKLVEYMSTHLEFAKGQFGSINANIKSKGDWLALTAILNSLGGSNKTTDQWKKCWIDLKAGVKKKINARRSFSNKTGGGSIKDAPQDLNDFEEQILSIMGTHAVDGDSTAVEAGVAPLAEPIFSIEIIEDEENMEESYSLPALDVSDYKSDLPYAKNTPGPYSSRPSTSKQSSKPTKSPENFKKGMEEAKEMHAALIKSVEIMDSKIERIESKIDKIEKKNKEFFVKFECLIDVLKKDM